jgi:hypothetical protein
MTAAPFIIISTPDHATSRATQQLPRTAASASVAKQKSAGDDPQEPPGIVFHGRSRFLLPLPAFGCSAVDFPFIYTDSPDWIPADRQTPLS